MAFETTKHDTNDESLVYDHVLIYTHCGGGIRDYIPTYYVSVLDLIYVLRKFSRKKIDQKKLISHFLRAMILEIWSHWVRSN